MKTNSVPMLIPYSRRHGMQMTAWTLSADDLMNWANKDCPLDSPQIKQWHAVPDVHPFVLCVDDLTVGYAELWLDRDENEVELARIIIAPNWRRRAYGRILVNKLCEQANALQVGMAILRVHQVNYPAISCYLAAGFHRVDIAEERLWNQDQPFAYAWFQRSVQGS